MHFFLQLFNRIAASRRKIAQPQGLRSGGFTLIELVVGVAMMAILGAIALGAVHNFRNLAKEAKIKADKELAEAHRRAGQADNIAAINAPSVQIEKDLNILLEQLRQTRQ